MVDVVKYHYMPSSLTLNKLEFSYKGVFGCCSLKRKIVFDIFIKKKGRIMFWG